MTPLLSEVLARELQASCDIELAMCEHCCKRTRDGMSRGCSAKFLPPDGSVPTCSNARDGGRKKQAGCNEPSDFPMQTERNIKCGPAPDENKE